MGKRVFHCLFEQSGTFKNVFKQHGHDAYDYDVLNDYGQTDHKIDLFAEIDNAYKTFMGGGMAKTIFDEMQPNQDFIIAFFPCTYFCDRNEIIFKLWNGGKRLPLDELRIKRLIERNNDRAKFFDTYLKFCFVCKQKGIPTIIENPASGGGRNYLELFSPIDVAYKEKNRALFGDDFKKPTNFFAINFDMKENFTMYYNDNRHNTVRVLDVKSESISTGGRSAITETYAKNFYERFIQAAVDGGAA